MKNKKGPSFLKMQIQRGSGSIGSAKFFENHGASALT